MSKKYLKNEKGIVRAITTENLQLEKPLLNEYYDIEVHNRNSDKIDSAITSIQRQIGDNITRAKIILKDLSSKVE